MALIWYLGLKRECVQTWRSLAESFLDQYKYNMDMAPNRSQLQNMVKGERETFKGYAQHWRELAARIQPPLSENEMTMMFIDTLHSSFYEKMVGNMSSSDKDRGRDENRKNCAKGGHIPSKRIPRLGGRGRSNLTPPTSDLQMPTPRIGSTSAKKTVKSSSDQEEPHAL
ncbi:hypothetical protein CR513_53317, partial [Mucuna pruriens]